MIGQAAKTLVKKELKSYFLTPLGYVFLVIFLFGIGYVTFEAGRGSFFLIGRADLSSFFRYLPWMFIFLIPAVTMKLWAEERKTGTIEFLFTLPITGLYPPCTASLKIMREAHDFEARIKKTKRGTGSS